MPPLDPWTSFFSSFFYLCFVFLNLTNCLHTHLKKKAVDTIVKQDFGRDKQGDRLGDQADLFLGECEKEK